MVTVMKYIKKDLGSYNLHIIKTDKFKAVTVRVAFRSPIVKEEITMRNILCDIFLQSSKKYKSKRSLNIKAQDLYAADIQTTNSRLGNYINTDFYLTTLNDKYTEKGNFEQGVEFLAEIIFNPDVKNNKFNAEKLDIVKTACKSSLESIKEDTSSYALVRLAEALDKKSPTSYRMMGYLEDLDKVTPESLYEYYQKMIKTNLVDIFVIGEVDCEMMVELFRKYFCIKTLKKRRVPYLVKETKPRTRRLFAKEENSTSQSQLAIACRINKLTKYERNYPLTLYNIILGGGSDSKLFKNVREENSLCYYINSVPNKLDNLIIIRAGIDKDNFKKTVSLIEKDIELMKRGKFSDSDINVAKEYYNTALEELEESEARIIDNYYMMELIGTDSIEAKREMMNKVTKKDIINVAKKIKMDTVFLLEGVSDERN